MSKIRGRIITTVFKDSNAYYIVDSDLRSHGVDNIHLQQVTENDLMNIVNSFFRNSDCFDKDYLLNFPLKDGVENIRHVVVVVEKLAERPVEKLAERPAEELSEERLKGYQVRYILRDNTGRAVSELCKKFPSSTKQVLGLDRYCIVLDNSGDVYLFDPMEPISKDQIPLSKLPLSGISGMNPSKKDKVVLYDENDYPVRISDFEYGSEGSLLHYDTHSDFNLRLYRSPVQKSVIKVIDRYTLDTGYRLSLCDEVIMEGIRDFDVSFEVTAGHYYLFLVDASDVLKVIKVKGDNNFSKELGTGFTLERKPTTLLKSARN